ncbi:MAG: AraC family transcriptional regulator [Bacteroidota bacterium]
MSDTIINIKNMVCPRCVTAVMQTLEKLNIPYVKVKIGQADLSVESSQIDFLSLDKELKIIGFEIIQDKNLILVERVKSLIEDYINNFVGKDLKINFSKYLISDIGIDYSHISKIFSETENITIEKYIIIKKVEKVKELIGYDELNFSEIAFKVNYSSVAHLSKQFKQNTGLTLSQYKKQEQKA